MAGLTSGKGLAVDRLFPFLVDNEPGLNALVSSFAAKEANGMLLVGLSREFSLLREATDGRRWQVDTGSSRSLSFCEKILLLVGSISVR